MSPRTLGSAVLVVVLAAAFVTTERRVSHPLIRLGIFGNRALVRANLTAMAVFGGYAAFRFVVALYLQGVLGWSPLQMALSLLPTGVIVAASGAVIGKLIIRYGAGRLIAIGMGAFVLAYALFLRVDGEPAFLTVILPTAVLLGIGFALCFSALNVQATNGVADDEQGLASGLVQTSFQIGGAVVPAATSAIVSSSAITPGEVPSSFYPALVLITAVSVTGLGVALIRPRQATAAA